MFWAERTNKLAGATLLILAALIIVNIVLLSAAVGDADLTKRGDIEGILNDIHDNKALYFAATGFSIAVDAALLPVAGALLYLVFRERSRALAVVGLAGFVAAGIAFVVADSANLVLAFLAEDFVKEGGVGGIATGDPVILQSARTIGTFGAVLEVAGSMPIALGFLGLGSLLAWAAKGEINPPRWIGWLGLVIGVAVVLQWVGAANEDVGAVFFTIGPIGSIIWFVILGGWLFIQPEHLAETSAARSAATANA